MYIFDCNDQPCIPPHLNSSWNLKSSPETFHKRDVAEYETTKTCLCLIQMELLELRLPEQMHCWFSPAGVTAAQQAILQCSPKPTCIHAAKGMWSRPPSSVIPGTGSQFVLGAFTSEV